MATPKKKYYSFDIETNEKTGELYLWCVSLCEDFQALIENPKTFPTIDYKWGTTWEDFFTFLDKIEKGSIIFIHNMSFDFNAILANCPDFDTRYNIDNEKSIITGYHSFIRIVCEQFIILDSAQITRMSIYGIGELVGIPKLEEEYNGVVTSNSILYCFRDTELSLRGVAYFCNAYGVKSIPLTSTGYNKKVINRVIDRNTLYEAKTNNKNLVEIEQNYKKFHELVRKSYSGGVCYANMFYAGNIVSCGSADIGSSYPTTMLGYLMPSAKKSALQPITQKLGDYIINTFKNLDFTKAFSSANLCENLGNYYKEKGFLCKVVIDGKMKLHIFENKNYFPLLSLTKKRTTKTHYISGLHIEKFAKFKTCFNKLLFMEDGDHVELALNEYDLYMLLKCYDIENIKIEYGYIYNMELSPFLCETVKTFLNDKNLCKHKDTEKKWNNEAFRNLCIISEETQDESLYKFVYQRTKECVNGMYGINVEDREKPKYIMENGEIKEIEEERTPHESPYNELIGAYISSLGRWQLFISFMGVVLNSGVNYYSDTDSIKVGNCKIEKVLDYFNTCMDNHFSKLEKKYKSFEKPTKYNIGTLEQEDVNGMNIFKFCTIGSKNYLCYGKGKIKATISGVRNCSKIFNKLLKAEKSFKKVIEKYYHYGLIIQNNKLVPNYSELGKPLQNGNKCVVLQYSDFSLMADGATGVYNKMVAETFFGNTNKCFERKEIIINGN